MANNLSVQLLEQMYGQYSDIPVLMLVTISHASFPTIYLVDNIVDQVSRGNTYRAFPMKIRPPTDDGESTRELVIEFDNVSLELIQELRTVTTAMDVLVEMVLANDLDVVQLDYTDLKIRGITYDAQKVTATLFMDDFMSVPLSSEKYTPLNFPGLF